MHLYRFLFLLLFPAFCFSLPKEAGFCFFIPPSDWQCADPKSLSSYVHVGFFGKGKTSFHPSLNLAAEEVGDLSLKDYLKSVKDIHEKDRSTSWRDLGKFQTQAGVAELTEISTQTRWGEVKMLQLIMVANKTAYVLTGAMLKEEFADFRAPIIKAFRSFTLTQDLFRSVSDADKQQRLRTAYQGLESSPERKQESFDYFQKLVLSDYKEMGMHWQILLLKDAYDKLDLSQVMHK